ncbi:sensor domain-containing diguanylate cyclase [uncultured Schumannella sp.]|uniref:sensor domain-containing diguanylate cyclase n=1 Tax=uncultured Schumannella sp. TaxID=1195956 RepID=UPI0025F2DC86|nr:sensor domain-containing diguanylate cyclase [uncultured Schumannella sp.]
MTTTLDGMVIDANATMCSWLETESAELVGKDLSSLLTGASQLFYDTRYVPVLRLRGRVNEVSMSFARADGSSFPTFVSAHVPKADDETSARVQLAVFDARERRDYERELLSARRAAESSAARVEVLHAAGSQFAAAHTRDEVGSILADAARRAFDTARASVLLQSDATVELRAGEPAPEAAHHVVERALAESSVVVVQVADELDEASVRDLRKERVETIVAARILAETDALGLVLLTFGRPRPWPEGDSELALTLGRMAAQALDRIALLDRLAHHATHDQLTGAANRLLLEDRVAEEESRSRLAGESFAVVMIDLDGFKAINDRHGHHTGDEVLRVVAARLQALVRDEDTVARVGGDEFVLVCRGANTADAERIAARVRDAFAEPLDVAPGLQLAASVGFAVHSSSTPRTIAELLRDADAAMYRAKAHPEASAPR